MRRFTALTGAPRERGKWRVGRMTRTSYSVSGRTARAPWGENSGSRIQPSERGSDGSSVDAEGGGL